MIVTAGVKHVNDSNGQVQSVEDNDGRVWLHPDQKGHRKDVALIRLKQTLNPSPTVETAWFLKAPMDYDFEKKSGSEAAWTAWCRVGEAPT